MPRVISPPRRQVCGNFGRRHPDASHHHHSSFRRSAGRSTGCGRAALAIRTTLELGIEFGVLQTGADLLSGKPAKSTTAPCSSRAARVDRDGVLGATRSFNVPGNHTARGAAALGARGAASGGKSQAARSLLISPHTSSGGYAAGPPTPGVCEAFSPALALSRAPEPHPSVALAVYGSTALQVPPNMLQTCRTMRRRLGDLARPRCERAPPRSSRACSYTFVHVAAGPATAIATTAATLATQSCSARLDGQ
jgi:hypothetical protein